MSDFRIVQCFGTLRRPHKEPKPCRKRYLWGAVDSNKYSFGRNGARACPICGTPPDHRHPFNKFLNGEMGEEEAKAAMPDYLKMLEDENNS